MFSSSHPRYPNAYLRCNHTIRTSIRAATSTSSTPSVAIQRTVTTGSPAAGNIPTLRIRAFFNLQGTVWILGRPPTNLALSELFYGPLSELSKLSKLSRLSELLYERPSKLSKLARYSELLYGPFLDLSKVSKLFRLSELLYGPLSELSKLSMLFKLSRPPPSKFFELLYWPLSKRSKLSKLSELTRMVEREKKTGGAFLSMWARTTRQTL